MTYRLQAKSGAAAAAVGRTRRAYQGIRSLMLHNEIAPGQKISYRELAERLGMSQTPVIQALKWLEFQQLATVPAPASFEQAWAVRTSRPWRRASDGPSGGTRTSRAAKRWRRSASGAAKAPDRPCSPVRDLLHAPTTHDSAVVAELVDAQR